jgi:outer membrane protein assembly factor BamD (BamD/ComL family)
MTVAIPGHGFSMAFFFGKERSMLRRWLLLGALCLAMLAGCSGEKGKELYDTAQFEEKQGNREHATKLYQEIVAKYPGSELAKKAESRLTELNKAR